MSRERRLDVACALVNALVDVIGTGSDAAGEEAVRRKREAQAVLGESWLPTAVFGPSSARPRIVNAAWRELFPNTTWPELQPHIDALYEPTSGVIHLGELALESTGHPVYCAATLRPIRDASGAVTGSVVVCMMTTDEVLARELAVASDALIWSAPVNSDVDYFNDPWRKYVGGDAASWQAAIEPEDLSRCTAALAEAARERMSSDVEVRIRRSGGEPRWHRVRFSSGHSRARWFGTAIDIHDSRDVEARLGELVTRERAARADAELANRLKDQFLAAVSHELRAPLTTMLLWEKVLTDGTADPALRARALEAIRESALSQSHLVGDLLDVSRAISGKLFVDLRPIDLEAVVTAALAGIVNPARDKDLKVSRLGNVVAGDVLGDAVRLRQVLDNLLSNAVKFTEPAGSITITVERKSRSVTIEVADTGRGIAPDFLSRLFEPFSQTEDSLTRRSGGLGLGLTIAKQLVELHHGTLIASSPGLGRGATFTISLPLAVRRIPSPPLGVSRPPALDTVRVLVIDDDRRVRDALALLLRRAGAAVLSADSAENARAQISDSAPDVIVCDIAMPGEDGYHFIEQLRRTSVVIPAIALTAHATEADARRARAAGFDVHLAKPIDFERLVATIDRLIVTHRARTIT
jgi:signal transduction histidine kinase/ActR/RegA family two-component response regulator